MALPPARPWGVCVSTADLRNIVHGNFCDRVGLALRYTSDDKPFPISRLPLPACSVPRRAAQPPAGGRAGRGGARGTACQRGVHADPSRGGAVVGGKPFVLPILRLGDLVSYG